MANLINTTSAAPTYNLPEIMRRAWAAYDKNNCLGDRSRFKFNRVFFAQMLAAIWKQARKEMEAAKLAAIPAAEKAARRDELEGQLTSLNFLPAGMNVSRRADTIKTELAKLAA